MGKVVGTVYHLALPLQDLNSGLVGPLIVCRKDTKASIGHRVLHFMIFNENESWYFEENINTYSQESNQVDRSDVILTSATKCTVKLKYSSNDAVAGLYSLEHLGTAEQPPGVTNWVLGQASQSRPIP
ncbi:hypothetical protein J1605_006545 [Eschrichtius robustus]|uniref:Uncharacterized protein n=1 Tax=Eschrichtius robustus TaxID=9764 RepID=A0AB34H4W9_ESCRO|nr:hypothetical protein J1605_006545 [Eschrichtius robustus]